MGSLLVSCAGGLPSISGNIEWGNIERGKVEQVSIDVILLLSASDVFLIFTSLGQPLMWSLSLSWPLKRAFSLVCCQLGSTYPLPEAPA